MKLDHYTYLLANPQKITPEDLSELDSVVQKFPFFQSARALQLKALKNKESSRYNNALKLAAAHTADRDILFEYITSEKFIQNEISQTILQLDTSEMEIEVVSENISEEVSEKIRIEREEVWKLEREKADAILNPDLFQRKVESVTTLVSNSEENIEENIEEELHEQESAKPLEFTKMDTHSFSEWLKLTKAKPIVRADEEAQNDQLKDDSAAEEEKERKFELIDKFIQERPKLSPANLSTNNSETEKRKNTSEAQNNLGFSYSQSSDSLMTETLARVYLQQKNYKKAIQAYKILILKNPEKSGFFADQIRAIQKTINTEQQ